MNRRIKEKIRKRNLNTPRRYMATAGLMTPYACPNCGSLYSYKIAYDTKECLDCGQKLIWWDVDPHNTEDYKNNQITQKIGEFPAK